MTDFNFRALPVDADQRTTAEIVNNILSGNLNNRASVTLTNSTTTSAVTNYLVGPDSIILFMPTTAAAATELASGSMYVSARAENSFTITHTSATSTRTFAFVVIG